MDEPTVEVIAGWADGRLDISHPHWIAYASEAVQAILAHTLGSWEALRGPGPVTWREAQLSLQVMAEERVGTRARQALMEAKAREDGAAEAVAAVVRRMNGSS